MPLLLGDTVPDFSADTATGHMSFHDWIDGDRAFFFGHPADFTPVCTTGKGRSAQLSAAFAKRGVKPIGQSTDTVSEHLERIDDVNDTQHTTLAFPIVADPDLATARACDMIHPAQSETQAMRSVLIIDSAKKLRLTMTYPMNVGRDFDEILRAIDALQMADARGVALPADWQPGNLAIVPTGLSDDAAKAQFPREFTTLCPYLCTVDLNAKTE